MEEKVKKYEEDLKKSSFFSHTLVGFTNEKEDSIIKTARKMPKNVKKRKKEGTSNKGGNSMKKRIASIALSLAMCLTLLPTAAYAEDVSEGGGI